ncbi:MAG: TetR/AcrR family transcriptional regulator [Labedaea sp.]
MKSPVRSRRERPAKRALSLEWIIAETIEIMRTEGLEKATMRRVAQALDTGPASLYVYVANTAELHGAVLDELIGSLEAPAGKDWQTRLEGLLGGYAEVLFTYPGLARSALVLRPIGPNAIRLYDRVLGLLIEGGIPADRAAWGVNLLLQHVTANAAEHSPPASSGTDVAPSDADELNAMTQALRTVDADTAPNVAAHVTELVSGTPAGRVSWAIHVLLHGIAAVPIPAGPDGTAHS